MYINLIRTGKDKYISPANLKLGFHVEYTVAVGNQKLDTYKDKKTALNAIKVLQRKLQDQGEDCYLKMPNALEANVEVKLERIKKYLLKKYRKQDIIEFLVKHLDLNPEDKYFKVHTKEELIDKNIYLIAYFKQKELK